MIGRSIAFIGAVVVAVIFSQVPEFAQQYRQRLSGALGELRTIIARFDADAAHSGYDRQEALVVMSGNDEALVRDQAESMRDTIARYERLSAQMAAFEREGAFGRLAALAGNFDAGLVQATFDHYEPAVPTTAEGFTFGGAGYLAAYLLLLGSAGLVKRRRRRKREARLAAAYAAQAASAPPRADMLR